MGLAEAALSNRVDGPWYYQSAILICATFHLYQIGPQDLLDSLRHEAFLVKVFEVVVVPLGFDDRFRFAIAIVNAILRFLLLQWAYQTLRQHYWKVIECDFCEN